MRPDVSRFVSLAAMLILAWPLGAKADEAPTGAVAESSAPCETVLRIHGSTTIGANLMSDLLLPFLAAEGWTDLKRVPAAEGASYTVIGRPTGSARPAGAYVEISDPESALTALDQGFADIAMSSRRVRPAEARQLTRLGELTSTKCEHVIALDGLAVIVNAANPVDALTRSQLKDIFLRRTVSWQEVGGSGPIHLYACEPKSGNGAIFQSAVLDDEELSPDARRFAENQALAEAVAADPRGIGFVSSTFAANNRVVAISDGKAESRSFKPGATAIRSGDYLLSRRLYLYTAEHVENPLAHKFLTFALGKSGQSIVIRDGFVSPTFEPSAMPREPVAALASNPSAPTSAPSTTPAEPRTSPTPAAAPHRVRVAEPTPAPTPRVRAEAAAPKPTPTPRPPRPAVARPPSAPAPATSEGPSAGTGG